MLSLHYIFFLSKQLTHPLALGLSWRSSSSSEPSFQNLPQVSDQPFCLQNNSAPAEAKQMSPGHPTHVRKLAQAASFVRSTNQSEKLKTLERCLLHPCVKEGAELPDSGRSLGTRRHSRSQTSPREHKAAGYGNFPWHPDMPLTKAGELSAFCHSSVLGQFPKALCVEEADHPEEQRAGTAPAAGWCRSPWQQTLPWKSLPSLFL